MKYGDVAVDGDHAEGDDANVHGDDLHEGGEGTHEVSEHPPLQQGGLELEGDGEHPNNDIRHRQVGNEDVGDAVHASVFNDDEDDEAVADHCQ